MARWRSVDVLRGLSVAAMLLVNDAGDWNHVHPWLAHAAWHGVAPPDLIFPLFLFIVGVSMQLAFAAPRAPGGPSALHDALARAARLVALGLALHAVAWLVLPGDAAYRPFGVLQRIGLCYGAAAFIALRWPGARAQWAWIAALLALHTAGLAIGGTLEPGWNLSDRIDAALLGAHAYRFDAATGLAHDPEGPWGSLTSLATVLLGLRAAAWLREEGRARLALGGALALAAGLAAAPWLPLNKGLWTASFAAFSGGAAMLMLALAHALIDRRGAPAPFERLGRQAISAYALGWLATCALEGSGLGAALYRPLFAAPLAGHAAPWVPSALYALVFTAAVCAAVWALDRRGWRLRV